ncbi:hypothetical protein CC2G_000034 [Coprinopsis cinerea AmutBmut pab1-1]|nr:hypothetical protein CC2G_000034 [Coprinopsis cinerea AmutBmut pab1-1]
MPRRAGIIHQNARRRSHSSKTLVIVIVRRREPSIKKTLVVVEHNSSKRHSIARPRLDARIEGRLPKKLTNSLNNNNRSPAITTALVPANPVTHIVKSGNPHSRPPDKYTTCYSSPHIPKYTHMGRPHKPYTPPQTIHTTTTTTTRFRN